MEFFLWAVFVNFGVIDTKLTLQVDAFRGRGLSLLVAKRSCGVSSLTLFPQESPPSAEFKKLVLSNSNNLLEKILSLRELADVGFLLLAYLLFIGFIAAIFWAVRSYFVHPSKDSSINSRNLERRIDILEQKLDTIIELLENRDDKHR